MRNRRGVYSLEWAVFMAAAVIAAIAMRPYVDSALQAQVRLTEIQLNGAMVDNRP